MVTSEPCLNSVGTINKYRTVHGLSDLTRDATLDSIASDRVHEVQSNFEHGNRLSQLMYFYGYRTELGGENLGRSQYGEDRIFEMWKESVTHNDNMLRPDWTHIGYASVTEGGITWSVVVFLRGQ